MRYHSCWVRWGLVRFRLSAKPGPISRTYRGWLLLSNYAKLAVITEVDLKSFFPLTNSPLSKYFSFYIHTTP